MSQLQFPRPSAHGRWTRSGALVAVSMIVLSATTACHAYKYPYESKTGVGLTDRANDYCQRAAVKQGYTVVESGPNLVDRPTEVDVRMNVNDGSGTFVVSCSFDDAKRIAAIPRPQRGRQGNPGYMKSDANKARDVCNAAVRSSGYDARRVSVAEWNGGRQYRVNVNVRQGGADRNVACRFDGVAGTASVPTVTK